jgi:purine nucleoside phosphorylase
MIAPEVHGRRLGVVLGSGPLDGLLDGTHPTRIDTARGAATVHESTDVVLVRRHAPPPHIDPSATEPYVPAHVVDHHRTIAALCAAGCDRVLALGSVGSLRGWPVGTTVAPFDVYAPQVNPSFHDDERGHRVPGFDAPWRDRVLATWAAVAPSAPLDGGVYAQTTGPRFETPAEVRALAVHADVVGMTIASEVILAGEVGLAYAAVCVVDNLANGLAERQLCVEDLRVGATINHERLLSDLRAVIPALAARPRPAPPGGPHPRPTS